MVRWFREAVFLWRCVFLTGKSGEADFAGMFGTGFGFIFEYKKSDIFLLKGFYVRKEKHMSCNDARIYKQR